jgi:parvulin-like peptidyl-prolyl isomerase
VQNNTFKFFAVTALAGFMALLGACGGTTTPGSNTAGGVDPNETAATVNGKAIKFEEVERAVKQQAQGQESRMSPLELAGARLQVLQSLIEQEVMYQKAEKEGTVPTDEEVTAEINKRKVDSRLSAEEFDKQMKQAGLDDASFRETIKKGLAIDKLVNKITGRIEAPKDSEIEAFFKGNPDMFVKKRGVRLAAIVIDPSNSGEGDKTTNENEANLVAKEVLTKLQQPGSDFAALARDYSEDPSKFQGGDMGYFSEQELKQSYPQLAAGFMNPQFSVGGVTPVVPINGKGYIFKLQERVEKEENLTLDSPNVRPQINDLLVNNRKQLLAASYQAIAMNEAKIENYLAKKVVENPNELSGARPAGVSTPAPAANTGSAAVNEATPVANANSTGTANSSVAVRPSSTPEAVKPAATTPRPPAVTNSAKTSNANR